MYLGIDVGGTKTLLAVFDNTGRVVLEHKILTPKTYKEFLKDIETTLASELKDYDFGYCCCAAPGLLDRKAGVVIGAGNLNWLHAPLKKDLEKLLNHAPVLLENDAKLAGLSEAILVHERYNKVLYITISTGIGGGVIINGKISQDLIDLEPGYMMLEHEGKIQKWEGFASGKALFNKYGLKAKDINDPKIWQEYVKTLAPGIEQLLAVIQPELVIIGGGVGAHLEKFSDLLTPALKELESPVVKIPPVIKAQRPEEAVIYGCYELIRQHI